MYGDFQCPYCTAAQSIVRRVRARLDGRLRFAFRHLPLHEVHPDAQRAAEASEAAAAQGHVLGDARRAVRQRRALLARRPGRAGGAVGTGCRALPRRADRRRAYAARVERDADAARAEGIASTPTFIVNGRRHADAFDAGLVGRGHSRRIRSGPSTLAPPWSASPPCSRSCLPVRHRLRRRRGGLRAARPGRERAERERHPRVGAGRGDARSRPSSRPPKGGRSTSWPSRSRPGPSLALASSVFTSPGDNRMAFGVIAEDGTPVYGPTAVYVAPEPGAPGGRAVRRARRRADDRRALPLQAGRDDRRTRSSPSTAPTSKFAEQRQVLACCR